MEDDQIHHIWPGPWRRYGTLDPNQLQSAGCFYFIIKSQFLHAHLEDGDIMLWWYPYICPSVQVFWTFINMVWDIKFKLGIYMQ